MADIIAKKQKGDEYEDVYTKLVEARRKTDVFAKE